MKIKMKERRRDSPLVLRSVRKTPSSVLEISHWVWEMVLCHRMSPSSEGLMMKSPASLPILKVSDFRGILGREDDEIVK